MEVCAGNLEESYDVIVVGSGAAGLTAALVAADSGASVCVLEKASTLGGTTALSGGMVWVPASRLAKDAGFDDSYERALTYARLITLGRAAPGMLEAHLARGDGLLDFLETHAGVRFRLIGSFPDYQPELDGGAAGGRSLEPEPFDITCLGELARFVREDPRPPFLQYEYFEIWKTFSNFDWGELERRKRDGIVTRGRALVAPLVKAVADRGGTLIVDAGAERLLTRGRQVVGVRASGKALESRLGTVLASGGFEWSEELCKRFLSGPVASRCSVPTNIGDGLRMAIDVGADLANLNEAWWGIHAEVGGLESEGRQLGTIVTVERSLPGSIVVNRRGERFTNESASYYGFGKTLASFDSVAYDFRNLPAYLIGDGVYFERYGVLGVTSLTDAPDWLFVAESLAELAERLEIDPVGLHATIERFNRFAAEGRDPDFCRGERLYDRYLGDHQAPHPNLAPLTRPPYVALELKCGAIGTKGGVRTDLDGRALDPWDDPIVGLYAVGNVSAHPVAFGYFGAGSTLGPGLTMAHAAGQALVAERVAF